MHKKFGRHFPHLISIFEDLPLGVLIQDVNDHFRTLLWNRKSETIWELNGDQVLGKTPEELGSLNVSPFFQVIPFLSEKRDEPEEEVQLPNGRQIWIQSWKFFIHDQKGRPILLVGLVKDLTQLKKAAQESNVQKLLIQRISSNVPGIIYQCRMDSEKQISFTYLSDKIKAMTGFSAELVKENPEILLTMVHPDDRSGLQANIARTLREKTAWSWQGRIIDPKGNIVFVNSSASCSFSEDGSVYWDGILQDVTAIFEKERLLRDQSDKMYQAARFISLGEMAGNIAHEINTPLGSIGILSELAAREITKAQAAPEKALKHLSSINDMVFKISKIIKSMRTFARNDSQETTEDINFYSLVEEVLAVGGHRLKYERVTINLDRLPKDLMINCRPGQISQVLLNLLNNSCDAIKDKEERWIRIELKTSTEKYFEISMTDSGNGIPEEIAGKLFESFFTTKGPKEGTGLGLSISKAILKRHSGDLFYDPKCENTTFVLHFPREDFKSMAA